MDFERRAGEIGRERANGGFAERDDAFFVAFAEEADAAFVEREVFDAEVGELGDAKASGVEELENCAVAEIGCVGLRDDWL